MTSRVTLGERIRQEAVDGALEPEVTAVAKAFHEGHPRTDRA